VVRFRAQDRRYAVDVAAVGGVLPLEGIEPLPAPRPDVLGVLGAEHERLTVIAPFGAVGEHVLVLLGAASRFGLVVEEVERVVRIEESAIGAAPEGQDLEIVVGLAGDAMLLDAHALERHLGVSR
jgi:chemotaxis signal transduction protein